MLTDEAEKELDTAVADFRAAVKMLACGLATHGKVRSGDIHQAIEELYLAGPTWRQRKLIEYPCASDCCR